jgi:hypothetical protein
MIWQGSEDHQSGRQQWRRAACVWGIFAVLVAAAVGAQTYVPRAVELSLGPRQHAGSLSVEIPSGWEVLDVGGSTVAAQSAADKQAELLRVSLVDRAEQDSLLEAVSAGFTGDLEDLDLGSVVRRVRIEGRRGVMINLGGTVRRNGREVEVQVVRLAFEAAPGSVVTVELQTPAPGNIAAEVIVQQVARTVRVERREQA